MALNQLDTSIVNFIEEHFWEYQTVPSPDKIRENFGTDAPWDNKQFREALHKKYLLAYYDDNNDDGLSASQLLALNMVCNPDDKRSLRVKLNQAKITSQQWATWINDPKFMRHFSGRMQRNFKNSMPEVLMSVVESAIGGDVKAQTLYLEMSGAYQRSTNVNVNVDLGHQIDKLVEILQEELALHPDILNRVAERFEKELDAPSKEVGKVTGQLALSSGFDF